MPYGKTLVDTIESSGNLAITGNVTTTGTFALGSQALATPFAGEFEYDGRVPYFTPAGTQRGVVPGMQYYRLNSNLAGANATGAQNVYGVGVTLSSNTVYHFEFYYLLTKSSGATAHTISMSFGGTATVNNILWGGMFAGQVSAFSNFTTVTSAGAVGAIDCSTTTGGVVATGATAYNFRAYITGTVSVNAGGTLIPQYSLSAAPGGAYSTQTGSYFLIYPIGAAGSNINVGTWA